ncbi:hypothetical protein LTS18_005993 [Coniosporium uncinatum]|uniref:Uncharacterized protein n=1 Tax=Coniosporium uncinatum TaxID=93489 RepID=A0ACC3DCG2_9PEZI|nr:hypothetical protein LTS18_005993 [Coniosporium uncinatum]
MIEPVKLPYYRDPASLPSALPTATEIENATATLPSNRDPRYNGRIVIVREYVVKVGTRVMENEGNVLLFIEQHLSIPAPRLQAMYRSNGKLHIVMQLMPGNDLRTLWPKLSEDDKASVTRQLRQMVDEMRSLSSPGFFGSTSRGPLLHRFFLSPDNDPRITGPFDTEKNLNAALALRSHQNWAYNDRRGWISEFFDRNLAHSLRNHPSTFTHSDLHPQNVLVNEATTGGGKDQKELIVSAIVDWETAGWYPSYWEYAACFVDFQWCDDWPEKFEAAVNSYPLEAAMLKIIRQDLDF